MKTSACKLVAGQIYSNGKVRVLVIVFKKKYIMFEPHGLVLLKQGECFLYDETPWNIETYLLNNNFKLDQQ